MTITIRNYATFHEENRLGPKYYISKWDFHLLFLSPLGHPTPRVPLDNLSFTFSL